MDQFDMDAGATENVSASDIKNEAAFAANLAHKIRTEVHKAIRGQDDAIDAALVALFAGGHALFEGVPGTAKTLLVRTLAAACATEFKRIQFTPDLMPSDILGTNVYEMATSNFTLRKGPIFSEFVLADEVNRTPPKTQAALLEAMEERRVSIDGTSTPLPLGFTVFATQNPVEYEGTYPLPEAQLDRFLLKVVIDYPSEAAEREMVMAWNQGFKASDLATANIQSVANVADLVRVREMLPKVTTRPEVLDYLTSVVRATRDYRPLALGASPRATVALLQAAKATALMQGRDFFTPDDIKAVVLPVLRHRVLLRPEAELEGSSPDRVLTTLLASIDPPR
jgi:MoxR-like ATPase